MPLLPSLGQAVVSLRRVPGASPAPFTRCLSSMKHSEGVVLRVARRRRRRRKVCPAPAGQWGRARGACGVGGVGEQDGWCGEVEAWPLCVPWGNPEVEGSREAVEWQRFAQNYVSADRSSVLFSSG